jgi:hypothetical protein
VLDYAGTAAEMGKNLGDDLREGKATLPLIMAMQLGTTSQRDLIREAIETGAVTGNCRWWWISSGRPVRWTPRTMPRHRKRNAQLLPRGLSPTMADSPRV